MRLTALEEYGLRCLLRVAREATDEPVSAQTVAELEDLSLPYAQKLLRVLAQGGLIDSRRGAAGGYTLARPADAISMGDAIRVLGDVFDTGDVCERHTGESEVCGHMGGCTIRPVWTHIEHFIVQTLDALTLADLLRDQAFVQQRLADVAPVASDKELYCPVEEVVRPSTAANH